MRLERFKVVSVMDEAIDTEAAGFDTMIRYAHEREFKLIEPHVKPGGRPAVYHVKPVPHALWQSWVMSGGDHDDIRYRRAFQCGVEKVDGLINNEGLAADVSPTGKDATGKHPVWKEEEIDERFSPSEVLEIGSVVFKHSFLPRRTALQFAVPSLCVEALAHRPFRSADANQNSAPTATTGPLSADSGQNSGATANI